MTKQQEEQIIMTVAHTLQAKLWADLTLMNPRVNKEFKRQLNLTVNQINKLHRQCKLDFDVIFEDSAQLSENIEKLIHLDAEKQKKLEELIYS